MRKRHPGRLARALLGIAVVAAALLAGAPAYAATSTVPTAEADAARPAAVPSDLARQLGAPAAYICWTNVSIRSYANGRYVSAELGYGDGNYGMLRARASAVAGWERYFVCRNPSSGITYIRSLANNRYVSAELGYGGPYKGMLRARASAVAGWEYYVTYAPPGGHYTWIRSYANGRYVSAELGYGDGYYGMLRARARVVGTWEVFAW